MSDDERLALARQLVACLEDGREADAQQIVNVLTRSRESELFREVGRLTRELHDAIEGFLLDGRVAELARDEIPDARKRLNHVVDMTQESADKTLGAIEESLSLSRELGARAERVRHCCDGLDPLSASPGEVARLVAELESMTALAGDSARRLHTRLTEALMAQEFQDLSGQIIQKVIKLVQDVENKLVRLVSISGQKVVDGVPGTGAWSGPAVPGIDSGDRLADQDDVDDLLSSMGF